MARSIFPTIGAYYAADDRRLRSEEADYGVHWRLDGWRDRWRVSYVRDTGEIYAVYNAGAGPVILLGHVPPDPVADNDYRSVYYATLERILDGWAARCTTPNGLVWVRDRLAAGATAEV